MLVDDDKKLVYSLTEDHFAIIHACEQINDTMKEIL